MHLSSSTTYSAVSSYPYSLSKYDLVLGLASSVYPSSFSFIMILILMKIVDIELDLDFNRVDVLASVVRLLCE